MIITWYGENCFKIQSGDTTIVTDPFPSSIGLTPPRGDARAFLKTSSSPTDLEMGSRVIVGGGEYELDGISILGINIPKEKIIQTMYRIEVEGITLGIIGGLETSPQPKDLEDFEEVDILILPGGGDPYISAKEATQLVKHIEPKIVIPSLFKISGLKRKAGDVADFLKEMGQKSVTPEEKIVLKKKDLEEIKGTSVRVLKI